MQTPSRHFTYVVLAATLSLPACGGGELSPGTDTNGQGTGGSGGPSGTGGTNAGGNAGGAGSGGAGPNAGSSGSAGAESGSGGSAGEGSGGSAGAGGNAGGSGSAGSGGDGGSAGGGAGGDAGSAGGGAGGDAGSGGDGAGGGSVSGASGAAGESGSAGSSGEAGAGGTNGAGAGGAGGETSGAAGNGGTGTGGAAGEGSAGAGGAAGDGGAGGAGAGGAAGEGGAGGVAGAGGLAGAGGVAGAGGLAGESGAAGAGGNPTLCHATPAPDDAPRAVVMSIDAFTNGKTFELLWLAPDGTLSHSGTTFELGKAEFDGRVSFTPDGRLGATVIIDPASNTGRVAVFRVDGNAITITEPGYAIAGFDPRRVAIDPSGSFVWALEPNRFGALTTLALDCDGKLSPAGAELPATLPRAVGFVPGAPDRAVLASRAGPAFGSTPLAPATFRLFDATGGDAHELASVSAYADDDEDGTLTGFALTADGKYALTIEDNLFASDPSHNNRLAVAALGDDTIARTQIVTYTPPTPNGKELEAPFDLIASPYNNAALVSAGLGSTDAIWRLTYDPADAETPFAFVGEIAYSSGPQLPGTMVGITSGALKGHVLVVEVPGVRQLQFLPDGNVVDRGMFEIDGAVGAIGIQPLPHPCLKRPGMIRRPQPREALA
jgi:hypothetical protein